MSGSRLISAFGLVILCQLSVILASEIVPAVVWGGEQSNSSDIGNPLKVITEDLFNEYMQEKLGGSLPPIAVLVKETLCSEDLKHQTPGVKAIPDYLPAVESPLTLITSLPQYNVSYDQKPNEISNGEIIVMTITDLSTIADPYRSVRALNPAAMIVLTGQGCGSTRSERTRRAVLGRADTTNNLTVLSNNVFLYSAQGLYLQTTAGGDYTFLGDPSASNGTIGTDDFQLELTYSVATLTLNFTTFSNGYWNFTSVIYNDGTNSSTTLLPNIVMYFPKTFSYHCSQNVSFANSPIRLNFTKLQVQANPRNSTVTGTAMFSDSYDCVGFTSIPIWSGLLVTAVMGLILIWALTMIIDIRTMDRFDDPKGKTITVANTE